VLEAQQTAPDAEVKEYLLSDGRIVTCTPDHPVYNSRTNSFQAIDSFGYMDTFHECQNPSLSSLRESNSEDTLNQKTIQTDPIIDLVNHGSKKESNRFIVRSGLISLVKYQMGIISTMSTEILIIIQSKISSAFQKMSTMTNTLKNTLMMNCASFGLEWITQGNLQANGTNQAMDQNGTPLCQRSNGRTSKRKNTSAQSAARNTHQNALKKQSSAQKLARQKDAGDLELMTSMFSVHTVDQHSEKTNMQEKNSVHLIASRAVGKAAVYNLKIENHPEFYANGILVHNCDALGYLCNRLFPVHRPKANEPIKQNLIVDEWGLIG
jgi:hypothetical protein